MKRRFAALCLSAVLACVSPAARATEPLAQRAALGGYAQAMEGQARARGMQVRRDTTFAWSGLPLLDSDLDAALQSLLAATKLRTRAWGVDGQGYAALDILLQNVSVLDVSLYAADGVYYEQSNLLGGETVALSAEEFTAFVGRVSSLSDGALPANLDGLFAAVLGMLGDPQGSQHTPAMAAWRETALTETTQPRPTLYIPGLYARQALVIEVTREEALDWAARYVSLIEANDSAADTQSETDKALHETAHALGQSLRNLPQTLAAWLPQDGPFIACRTLLDADNALVTRQLEITLSGGGHLLLEWAPREDGIPPLYASLMLGELHIEALLTREDGTPQRQTGSYYTQTNRQVVQILCETPSLRVDAVGTVAQQIDARTDRELITTNAKWTLHSEALFGADTVVTLHLETRDSASMPAGEDYQRKAETTVWIKGLGFDSRPLLALTTRTTLSQEHLPMPALRDAIRPALLDDATFDAWVAAQGQNLVQACYTVLGRLPADVAAYLLALLQASNPSQGDAHAP